MESIFAARDAIKPKPPTNSIVRADRPKSTAFKCRKCKQKLVRGQLAQKTCHVRMNPYKAEWREEGTKYTHTSCLFCGVKTAFQRSAFVLLNVQRWGSSRSAL